MGALGLDGFVWSVFLVAAVEAVFYRGLLWAASKGLRLLDAIRRSVRS